METPFSPDTSEQRMPSIQEVMEEQEESTTTANGPATPTVQRSDMTQEEDTLENTGETSVTTASISSEQASFGSGHRTPESMMLRGEPATARQLQPVGNKFPTALKKYLRLRKPVGAIVAGIFGRGADSDGLKKRIVLLPRSEHTRQDYQDIKLTANLHYCQPVPHLSHPKFQIFCANATYLNGRYSVPARWRCRKNSHDCMLKVYDEKFYPPEEIGWNKHKLYQRAEVQILRRILCKQYHLVDQGVAPKLIDYGLFNSTDAYGSHAHKGPYIVTLSMWSRLPHPDRASATHLIAAFASLYALHSAGYTIGHCTIENMVVHVNPDGSVPAGGLQVGFVSYHEADWHNEVTPRWCERANRRRDKDMAMLFCAFAPVFESRVHWRQDFGFMLDKLNGIGPRDFDHPIHGGNKLRRVKTN